MSMQGSAMMYVTAAVSLVRRPVRQSALRRAPCARSSSADLATTWSKPAACARRRPVGVGVVREAEDRDLRIGVRDLVRVDARDVRDHAVRRVDVVDRDQSDGPATAPSSFPRKKRSTPTSRIVATRANVPPSGPSLQRVSHLETGLDLIRRGEFFAAHEELEDAWRAAEPAERDFYQGLVHVAVAWYQAGRGNRVGCERQLEKAARRLAPYAPEHRGVDVASLLAQVDGGPGVGGRRFARAAGARAARRGLARRAPG